MIFILSAPSIPLGQHQAAKIGFLFAQEAGLTEVAEQVAEVTATADSGNTAWMLTATVLVLFMTLPGLALFYGGLVRSRNVLSVFMHCYAIG